ncbi:hypothetical protein A5780_30140 [Nocardia sp. 852002-20019_SCH5090214]|uniref:Nuclear transport factor 2 family protein n=1 Tax=Nocardia nova TaxID=37330 RepID=A0A2S5ZXH7_9NOCA|nr:MULTISPECIES: hypothetical protein [Nocardia]OBA51192.1 hypothetical protein A5780_30140 [Nocardia sp. 852002-20019_SCH5090214]PPJ22705.1 hypothetical protein C5F51_30750 [Nocardia nova]
MPDQDFRELYERHVGAVASGDFTAALADMVQENLPTVFDGVSVPRGIVNGVEIRDVRVVDGKQIGETVYTTPEGVIGLRSIWELREGQWKAAALENFTVSGESL